MSETAKIDRKKEQQRVQRLYHAACKRGDLAKVKYYLLSDEIPIKAVPFYNIMAGLKSATKEGQLDTVKFLLESQDLKNRPSPESLLYSLSRIAAESGHEHLILYAIESGAFNDNESLILSAAKKSIENRHNNILRLLVEHPMTGRKCMNKPVDLFTESVHSGNQEARDYILKKCSAEKTQEMHHIFRIFFTVACMAGAREYAEQVAQMHAFDVQGEDKPFFESEFNVKFSKLSKEEMFSILNTSAEARKMNQIIKDVGNRPRNMI